MRVAIGGFMHETNTFAPTKATYEKFERADSWPALVEGDGMAAAVAGINIAAAGFFDEACGLGFATAPLLWCNAGPSAHVTDDAFERIAGRMEALLKDAGAVDALYLDLHGAMATESLEDGEGALLERMRRVVGPDVPIVASLDLHANVTDAMVENADMLIGFRTYPHVDMAETGARAARALDRIAREGKPRKAFRRTDFLVSINWQCTLAEPARSLYRTLERLEEGEGVYGLSFCQGFPPADIWDCGPTVLAYAGTQAAADAAAERLFGDVEAARPQFDGPYHAPNEAVREAARLWREGAGPIVVADTQDNPGGGGDGDTTGMLRALVAERPEGAVLGLMIDPDAAAKAAEIGVGGAFDAALGGRSWPEDEPFFCRLTVEALGDGRFLCTGPFYGGANMELGQMALARVDDTGVRVVLASRKVQAADKEMFRHLGVEPAETRMLVLKSSVHFRADFEPIAGQVLIARAPGPVVADPADLPYRNLRPGVRLGPSGPVFERGA